MQNLVDELYNSELNINNVSKELISNRLKNIHYQHNVIIKNIEKDVINNEYNKEYIFRPEQNVKKKLASELYKSKFNVNNINKRLIYERLKYLQTRCDILIDDIQKDVINNEYNREFIFKNRYYKQRIAEQLFNSDLNINNISQKLIYRRLAHLYVRHNIFIDDIQKDIVNNEKNRKFILGKKRSEKYMNVYGKTDKKTQKQIVKELFSSKENKYHLTKASIAERLRNGENVDTLLSRPLDVEYIKVKYKGKIYHANNLPKLAEKEFNNFITFSSAVTRLRNNWKVIDILKTPMESNKNGRKCKYLVKTNDRNIISLMEYVKMQYRKDFHGMKHLKNKGYNNFYDAIKAKCRYYDIYALDEDTVIDYIDKYINHIKSKEIKKELEKVGE